jgi:hypothetical protein
MARLDYPSADLILLRLFFPLISVPFLSLLFLILQTILIVAGSSPTEENKINDILQGLLTCDSKELEGGGAMNLLQEKLQVKPICMEKLYVPDFPDIQPIDLKCLLGKSK